MKLIIRRSQEKRALRGGMRFILEARVTLESDEQELLKRYKADKEVLLQDPDNRWDKFTVADFLRGVRHVATDVTKVLETEEFFRKTCDELITFLDILDSFGGETEIEYTRADSKIRSDRSP